MRKLLLLTVSAFMVTAAISAQSGFKLPTGYKIYDNQSFERDFDGDGIRDLVALCSKNNDEWGNVIVVFLSTLHYVNKGHFEFPWETIGAGFEYKNDVLIIDAAFGTGRYLKTLKFKYYPKLNNMRLIGYDEYGLGNYQGDGAYSKSVNLLTNKYEINGKWGESKFDLITLSNTYKYLSYLEAVGTDMD